SPSRALLYSSSLKKRLRLGWAETKIHISRAAGENTLASAPRGGSCAHPDQSRGLARRRHLRAISGVGASSPLLLFFLGGGVALHERLVSECPNCPVPHQAALRLHMVL